MDLIFFFLFNLKSHNYKLLMSKERFWRDFVAFLKCNIQIAYLLDLSLYSKISSYWAHQCKVGKHHVMNIVGAGKNRGCETGLKLYGYGSRITLWRKKTLILIIQNCWIRIPDLGHTVPGPLYLHPTELVWW